MPGYLEFHVKGGARAYIEATSVRAFLTPPGGDAETQGTPDAPLSLILGNGGQIDTYGTSVGEVMLRISEVKRALKNGVMKNGKSYFIETTISWVTGELSSDATDE